MKGFFIFFLALDYLFNDSFKFDTETSSMLIGLTHHIPALYGSYKILNSNEFYHDKDNYYTDWSNICIMWTTAFFAFDVVYHIKYYWSFQKKKYIDFMIHAVACCITYMYIYESKKYHWFGAAFLTWEASTPFLYLSLWMGKLKMQNTIIYKLNSFIFTGLFFIFRIVFGSYVFWILVWPEINWNFRVIGITLNFLNYWWFKKILRRIC